MLPKAAPSVYQAPKCFVTYGSMGHTDTKQLPRRSKPWSNLMGLDFIHRVDVILPQEIYETLRHQLVVETPPPSYYRVTMSLEQVLQGNFFTEYIKRGNILMLSEGITTVDNMFTLREGVLTMYLDKETYERAGLVGKPHGAKGNRGLKPRWIVSYDLRSPSMLHGKKGFDRLVYASKKVLNQPLTWLFCNVAQSSPDPDPLQQHFPVKFTLSPGVAEGLEVSRVAISVPSSTLAEGDRSGLEMVASDLYEWFSLIRLESPRVRASDHVDPYLSRYRALGDPSGQMGVCRVSWLGFISTQWVRGLLAALITKCPSQAWFSLNATEFAKNIYATGNEISLVRPQDASDEYLMWEIKSTE